jgi:hypothetical protein
VWHLEFEDVLVPRMPVRSPPCAKR